MNIANPAYIWTVPYTTEWEASKVIIMHGSTRFSDKKHPLLQHTGNKTNIIHQQYCENNIAMASVQSISN